MMSGADGKSIPIPAAVVAFVRDAPTGIEIYLNRRPAHFRYYPGAFVFPGGRVDPDDADTPAAAQREIREEIGVEIDPSLLALLRDTHTNPKAGPIYHMATYAYRIEGDFPTTLNQAEVDEEVWIAPDRALSDLHLPYQVRAAIVIISGFESVEALFERLRSGCFRGDYYA